MGVQPRLAASVTPFECGATAVTTIGGWGFWNGFRIVPWPISGIMVLPVEMWKCSPCRSYGPSRCQISSTMSIASRKIALRSFS